MLDLVVDRREMKAHHRPPAAPVHGRRRAGPRPSPDGRAGEPHRPVRRSERRRPWPPSIASSTRDRASWKLDLDSIRALVAALDHPERAYPTVLIAGTNGKGSVAAMVERALRAAGLRTGRYTSPHLVRPEERFAIDGEPVDADRLRSRPSRDVLAVEAACRADGRLADRRRSSRR